VPEYAEVKAMAMLRAGRKISPISVVVAKIFAVLARKGLPGVQGFEGEARAREISDQLAERFRERYVIPPGETVYIYRGDQSPDEFAYFVADAVFDRCKDPRADCFVPTLEDALSAHVFRPHLDEKHLYAR